MFFRGFSLGLVLMMGVSACAVGPNYLTPQSEVPDKWSASPPTGVVVDERAVSAWWTTFDDPELNSLIERAVLSNKDLQLATARIRQARAQRNVAAAGAYPGLDLNSSYARTRTSGNLSSGLPSAEFNLFDAQFDSTWELDIFGRVRRSVEAANADVEASIQDRRDVLVSLLAEVARLYFEIRGDQLRLAITRRNVDAQRQSVELSRERFKAGLSSELDVAQAEAQLASTESQIPNLESDLNQSIYQLGVLLGLSPEALLSELLQAEPVPSPPPKVPVTLASDLLRRRPDIRRAERQLAAATANIGVAVADLFPQFSLTGSLGLESTSISKLVSSGSLIGSVGPSVSWSIFNAGRVRANIAVQNALQEQALTTYEKTVLTALSDVESALTAYFKEQGRRHSLALAVAANRKAVDISYELYAKGLVDFLNVLVNQRFLYQAEDLLALSDQVLVTDLAALYKALGGGWEISPY